MTLSAFRAYCLSKKGATEEFPFDENTAVYKVMDKMFALADVHLFDSINLKCDPDKALVLREQYEQVQPGYHMNKKHWNTILVDGVLPESLLRQWIDDSYALVVEGLPLKFRVRLER